MRVKSKCITYFILYAILKVCKSPCLIFTSSRILLLSPFYREGNGDAKCLTCLRSPGGTGARTQQSRAHHTHVTLLLQCLQRLFTALRINLQTPSLHPHLPPLHANSLAFIRFLPHHLLFPAPGPLHMLLPLCKILPTHFFRLKPTHPSSFTCSQRPSFPLTPDSVTSPYTVPSSPPLFVILSQSTAIQDYRIISYCVWEVHKGRDDVHLVLRSIARA